MFRQKTLGGLARKTKNHSYRRVARSVARLFLAGLGPLLCKAGQSCRLGRENEAWARLRLLPGVSPPAGPPTGPKLFSSLGRRF